MHTIASSQNWKPTIPWCYCSYKTFMIPRSRMLEGWEGCKGLSLLSYIRANKSSELCYCQLHDQNSHAYLCQREQWGFNHHKILPVWIISTRRSLHKERWNRAFLERKNEAWINERRMEEPRFPFPDEKRLNEKWTIFPIDRVWSIRYRRLEFKLSLLKYDGYHKIRSPRLVSPWRNMFRPRVTLCQ